MERGPVVLNVARAGFSEKLTSKKKKFQEVNLSSTVQELPQANGKAKRGVSPGSTGAGA